VALHKDGQVNLARKLIEDLTRQVPRLSLIKVLRVGGLLLCQTTEAPMPIKHMCLLFKVWEGSSRPVDPEAGSSKEHYLGSRMASAGQQVIQYYRQQVELSHLSDGCGWRNSLSSAITCQKFSVVTRHTGTKLETHWLPSRGSSHIC
jgi:hypothetical protein